MKKISLFIAIAIVSFIPLFATAQGFVPLAPIPGLTQGVPADQAGLANFFNNLYKFAIGFAAILAVIEIIWGGLNISTQDSVSKQGEGKERITNAIYGLILVLAPVLVFSLINPSILNLSLNLPPINLGTAAGTGGGGAGVQPATVSGCSSVSGSALQSASCSTNGGTDFISQCSAGGGRGYIPIGSSQQSCSLVSGQQVCTTSVTAVCETSLTGSFMTVDLGGIAYARYRAVGDNANTFNSFAGSCRQDGGILCGSGGWVNALNKSPVPCPSNLNIPGLTSGQGKCYNLSSLHCEGNANNSCQSGTRIDLAQ